MKNLILIFISLFILMTGWSQNKEIPSRPEIEHITPVNGKPIANQISNQDKVVLVLFNPLCGHCQLFIDSITQNYDTFKNVKFVFVYGFNESLNTAFREFSDKNNLESYPNLIFGTAVDPFFNKYMIHYLPSVFLYADKKTHKFVEEIDLSIFTFNDFLNKLN